MAIFLKKFETMSQYNAYTADTENFILPNVSLTVDNNTVHYNPSTPPTPTETRLVCIYNVTDTSNPIAIAGDRSAFAAIEIDGVVQPSVETVYNFSTTGEHTIKYTLTDTTSIGDSALINCDALTSVTIPNSVTTIGYGSFGDCDNLTSIDIPNSVTIINDGAFCGCHLLDAATRTTILAFNEYAFDCG